MSAEPARRDGMVDSPTLLIRDLIAAGVDADLVARVSVLAARVAELDRRRASDAERQRKSRANRHVTSRESRESQDITPPPSNGFPTPLPITTPSPSSELRSSEILSGRRPDARYSSEFEAFWKAYPRSQNMSKKEAFDVWKRLPIEDREAATRAVPKYVEFLRSKPDHPAIHACRFLAKRRFDGFLEPTQAASSTSGREQMEREAEEIRKRRMEQRNAAAANGAAASNAGVETADGRGIERPGNEEKLLAPSSSPRDSSAQSGVRRVADHPTGNGRMERMVGLFREEGMDACSDEADGFLPRCRH